MSSRSLRPTGRKIGVAALAASLGLAGLGLAASPAQAVPGFEFERLAGEDRVETAVDISADTFASSTTALIARADKFPDALAGNYLAGAESAPILLSHTDEVPQDTLDELARLGVTDVTLLGGTDALSADVAAALEAEGYTVGREAGTDRYKTAADIATSQDAATIGDTADGRTAILATGERFPDALTGGPLAYAGSHPLLLTPTAALGEDAAGALDALEIEHVLILGGTDAVSATVEAELTTMGMTSERLAGDFRWETATEIAEYALANAGFTDEHVNVATGRNFPDALTGGPHAGEEVTPILLADDQNTSFAVSYLEAHADTLIDGHIFGGTLAVSQAVEDTLEAAAQGEVATNQSFTVTPAEEATNEASTATTNDGRRTYTISGLDDTETYRLELFPSENITVDADGIVTFVDANDDLLADDDGNTNAVIETVNGLAVVFSDEMDVTSEDGTLTFTVDSTVAESIRPVLWLDAEATGDDELDVDADGAPTEDFGVGGIKNWFVEATAGAQGVDATVTDVDTENNFFDADGERFFYDANDVFQIDPDGATGCTTVNQATFENELSTADVVDSTTVYGDNDATVIGDDDSTFCLNNVNPDATVFQADPVNDTTVQVAIADDDDDQDSFNIYRADEACAGAVFPTDYTLVTTVAATDTDNDGDDEANFTDTGLTAATTYCYAVTAVNGGDEGTGTVATDEAITTAAGTQAAPTVDNAVLTTDDVVTGAVDDTDVWTLTFSEAMADTAGDEDGTFTITDGDGDVAVVDCGLAVVANDDLTSATCTYDGTFTILTITILETAEDRNVGGDGVLAYPVTITATDGVVDAGHSLEVDLANSADVVVGEGGTTGD